MCDRGRGLAIAPAPPLSSTAGTDCAAADSADVILITDARKGSSDDLASAGDARDSSVLVADGETVTPDVGNDGAGDSIADGLYRVRACRAGVVGALGGREGVAGD